jgi:hypothetical protein
MSIAAMKQALEALKEINKLSIGESAICLPAEIDAAMDALRQAIEQAEQAQPVAWVWKDGTITADPDRADGTWNPLYTSPPQRQWVGLTDEHAKFVIAMHTTLVNAHYDEHKNTNIIYEKTDSLGLVRAIEAALREKNA